MGWTFYSMAKILLTGLLFSIDCRGLRSSLKTTIFLKVRFIILNKIWGFRKSILSNKISLISKQFYCPLLLTSLLMSLSMLTISFFSLSFSLFGCIFRLDWICIQMRKPLTTCRPTSVEKTIEKIVFSFFIWRRWPFVVLNKWLQNV